MGGGSAIAEPQFTIRAGAVAPEGTPWADLLNRMKKRVEADSGNRIAFKIFLGGKLGGEESLVRRCQKGTLDMVGVSTAAMAAVVPELEVLELPYLFSGYKEVDEILDNVVRRDFEDLLAAKGFVLYQWSENGYRQFATKDRFVKAPGDLKGLKMRSQQNKVHIDMWNALGASPVPLPVPEVPSSLQNGVVAGYDNTLLYAYAAQWNEGIKFVTISEHIYQPAVIVFSKEFWASLPEDLKVIVTKTIAEDQKQGRDRIRSMNKPLVEQYKAGGAEFYKLSDAEREAFKQATRSVWDAFRGRSTTGAAILDKILAAKK
jgi:tripartite ATP-independent transporter DctP family solute receptor